MEKKKFWKYFLFALIASGTIGVVGFLGYIYIYKANKKAKELKQWISFKNDIKKYNNLLTNDDIIEEELTDNIKEKLIKQFKKQIQKHWEENALPNADFKKLKIELSDELDDSLEIETDPNDSTSWKKKIKIKLVYDGIDHYQEDMVVNLLYKPKVDWDKFIKLVENSKFFNLFKWDQFENGQTWEEVITKIKYELTTLFPGWLKIIENLSITFKDEKNKELSDLIEIKYANKPIQKITIQLKNGKNLLWEKMIPNVEVRISYSLKTKWEDFKKRIQKYNIFKKFEWKQFKNGQTWEEVIDEIKKKLEDIWEESLLSNDDFNKFDITLLEDKGIPNKDKELTGIINKKYSDSPWTITIRLRFNKESDLKYEESLKDITLSKDDDTKWSDFIDELTKNNNKKLINLIEWNLWDDLTTWDNIKSHLWPKLYPIFKDQYELGEINNLSIKFFDGTTDLTTQKIGDYSEKNVLIKLTYLSKQSLYKEIFIKLPRIKDSQTTSWAKFIKDVKDNNLLDISPIWDDIKDTTTWQELITKLKNSLEDTFNKHNLIGFEKLKLSLFNGTSELKTGEIGQALVKDKEINVSLFLDEILNSTQDIKIKIKYNLDLKTKWLLFIEKVTNNVNQLINSIEWSKFKDGDKWNALREEIRTKLKNDWIDSLLDNIDYNLIIDLYDKDGNSLKDKDITKQDVDNIKNITIKLSYKDEKTDDFTKTINDIAIKLDYSLTTKWTNFYKKVQDDKFFEKFDWSIFKNNKHTWENVIKNIKEKLAPIWSVNNLKSIDRNLDITLWDNDTQLSGDIDRVYADESKPITIKLSYKGENLEKEIKNINVKVSYLLDTKWSDFIDELTKNNNKKLINLIEWNLWDDLTTWDNIKSHLWPKLYPIFKDQYELGEINNLSIKFFDGTTDLTTQKIGDYSEKNVLIKLTYLSKQSLYKEIFIKLPRIKDSQTTSWAKFIKDVKDNNLLDISPIWDDIKDTTTWQELITKLKNSLEDTFNKHNLIGFEKLKLSLFNGTSELKTGEIGQALVKDKEINVSLFLDEILNSTQDIKIKIKYNLDLKTKWLLFIEKVTNNVNQLINSIEWSKFKDGDKWNALREEIRTKLKNDWIDSLLDNIDYNLIIDLYDKDGNSLKDKDITKQDVDNIKNITIKLSYKDEKTDDFTKTINDIAIKLDYSLTTKWTNFYKKVQDDKFFEKFDWSIFKNNKHTWENVIKNIKEKLAPIWSVNNLKSIDRNLDITLWDNDTQLSGDIDRVYADESKPITIKLSYKGENLEKEIKNINVKVSYLLDTKWSDFIDELTKNNNKKLINLIEWNLWDDLTTWDNIKSHLWPKLYPIFKDQYELGEINNLSIKFFDGTTDLTTQKIGDYSEKNVLIKLTYLSKQSLYKEIFIKLPRIKDSQTTSWAKFIKDVKDNNLLDISPIWDDIKDTTTWQELITKLKNSLEDTFNKHNLIGFEKLKLSLFNGTSELKTGEIGQALVKDKEINVSLFLDEILNSTQDIKIKIKYNLDLKTKWLLFIEKVTNNVNQLINSIEWSKFKDGDKWNALREEIRTKLKNDWIDSLLDNIDYNLIIDLYDKDGNSLKDKDITKQDVDNIKNITIKLSYKDEKTDDFTKTINDIAIKLDYSLTTKWTNFYKKVQDDKFFEKFDWSIFKNNKHTWENVIKNIKEKLAPIWSVNNLKSIDRNLDITLWDNDTQLSGDIDRVYADESKPITIKLSYKGENLEKEIKNINVKVSYLLDTKWSDFIDEIQKDILKKTDWYKRDDISDLTTWTTMRSHLQNALTSIFKKHELGDTDDRLNIKFYYENNKLTNEKIGDYFNKEIKIILELKHQSSILTKDITITLSKIQLSLTTKWTNFFVKAEKEIQNFKWNQFKERDQTWENVISTIKERLTTIWTANELEEIDRNLDITLWDNETWLSGSINRIYADNSGPISIELSYKGKKDLHKKIKDIKVQVSYSLETKWGDFIKEVQNKNLLTSIEWSKFKDGDLWANVISAIKERLQEHWNRIGSQVLGDINNLDIKITNNNNYLINDETIDETYADDKKNINIRLSYKQTELINKTKDIKVKVSYSKNTRWSRFINKVQNSDITSIKWTDFTEGQPWNDVIKSIIEKLKIHWNDIDTKVLGYITNNLAIQIFDNDTLLNDKNIDKIYATSEHKLTIKITYKDKELGLVGKEINAEKVLVSLSKVNSWNSFIKKVWENNNKLITSIDWSKKFKDGQTWADVIEEIRKHLEKHWPTKINDNLESISNLKIELFDKDGNKLNDAKISSYYARNEKPIINIALSHNTNQSLERKWVNGVIVQVSYSLGTKWEDFITKIEQNNNKLITSIDWSKFKDGQTWIDVIEEIRKRLEKHWPTDVRTNLGSISSNLIIELFGEDNNKLNDEKISTDYAYHNQTIKIKLTYDIQRALNKTITISNFKVSTSDETNWTDFIKEIKKGDNKLITSIDWTQFNKNGQTWEDIIRSIRAKLTNAWSNNKLGSVSDLNIRLLDGTDELKGIIKDKYINNKETLITVELSYNNGSGLKEEIKINIKLDNVNFKLLRDFQDYFVRKYKYNDLKDITFDFKFYDEKFPFQEYLNESIQQKFNSFVEHHSIYKDIKFDFDAFYFSMDHINKKQKFEVRTTLNGKQLITTFEYLPKPFDLKNLKLKQDQRIDVTDKFLGFYKNPYRPWNFWEEIYLNEIKSQWSQYSLIKDKKGLFILNHGNLQAPNPGEEIEHKLEISSRKQNKFFIGRFEWKIVIKRDKLDITEYVKNIFNKLLQKDYGLPFLPKFEFRPFHLHNFTNQQEVFEYIKEALKDYIADELKTLFPYDLDDRTRNLLVDYDNYDFGGVDFEGKFEWNNLVHMSFRFDNDKNPNYYLKTQDLPNAFWHIHINNSNYDVALTHSLDIDGIKQRLDDYIEEDSKKEIEQRFGQRFKFKGLTFDRNRTVKSILNEIIKNIFLHKKFKQNERFFISYTSKDLSEFVFYFYDQHRVSIRIKFLDHMPWSNLVSYDLESVPDINKTHITSSTIRIDLYENENKNSTGKWINKYTKNVSLFNKYELELFSKLTKQNPPNWTFGKSNDMKYIHKWILDNDIDKNQLGKPIKSGDDYMIWQHDQNFKYRLELKVDKGTGDINSTWGSWTIKPILSVQETGSSQWNKTGIWEHFIKWNVIKLPI